MSDFECGVSSRFDGIKSNAHWTRVHFDTMLWPSTSGCDEYAAHIQDCIDNPTTGLIARRRYITRKPMNYPQFAKRNKLIFDNQPELKTSLKVLREKINYLYPKTKYLRSYIIRDERVLLDTVVKGRPYTKLDKTLIFFSKLFRKTKV